MASFQVEATATRHHLTPPVKEPTFKAVNSTPDENTVSDAEQEVITFDASPVASGSGDHASIPDVVSIHELEKKNDENCDEGKLINIPSMSEYESNGKVDTVLNTITNKDNAKDKNVIPIDNASNASQKDEIMPGTEEESSLPATPTPPPARKQDTPAGEQYNGSTAGEETGESSSRDGWRRQPRICAAEPKCPVTAQMLEEHIAYRLAHIISANLAPGCKKVDPKDMLKGLAQYPVVGDLLNHFKLLGWSVDANVVKALKNDPYVLLNVTPVAGPNVTRNELQAPKPPHMGVIRLLYNELCATINGENNENLRKGQARVLSNNVADFLVSGLSANQIFDKLRMNGYDGVNLKEIKDVMARYERHLTGMNFREDDPASDSCALDSPSPAASELKKVRNIPQTASLRGTIRRQGNTGQSVARGFSRQPRANSKAPSEAKEAVSNPEQNAAHGSSQHPHVNDNAPAEAQEAVAEAVTEVVTEDENESDSDSGDDEIPSSLHGRHGNLVKDDWVAQFKVAATPPGVAPAQNALVNATVARPPVASLPVASPGVAGPTDLAEHPSCHSPSEYETFEPSNELPGRYNVRFKMTLANGRTIEHLDLLPEMDMEAGEEDGSYFLPCNEHIIPTVSKNDESLWVKDPSVPEWPGVYHRHTKKRGVLTAKPHFIMRKFTYPTNVYDQQYKYGMSWESFGDDKHVGGFDINNRKHVHHYNRWIGQIRARNDRNYVKRDIRKCWHDQELIALRKHCNDEIESRGLIDWYNNINLAKVTRLVNEARLKYNPEADPRTESGVQSQADRDTYEPRTRAGPKIGVPWPLGPDGKPKQGIKEMKEEAKRLSDLQRRGEEIEDSVLKPKNPLSLADFPRKLPGGKSHLRQIPQTKVATEGPVKHKRGAIQDAVQDAAPAKRKRSAGEDEVSKEDEHPQKRRNSDGNETTMGENTMLTEYTEDEVKGEDEDAIMTGTDDGSASPTHRW
ncbi:uncharacterized protein BDR25DRAFT_316099 [Lindgomyces ingoldianus]|uniref:Uncharacterized protein n=1 Tax=Lindgomyces ingoldianus TaxID=673940 RepID=A0ACB6QNQ5_9PLEO|nr:uncharacterized protein BDR25DRAFT_316099 [Lindgomyces ingoldianus]KAF2468649.1 hypothetical protein BDR25DRAFT_316099 [Lindgomyces ingoldianus]